MFTKRLPEKHDHQLSVGVSTVEGTAMANDDAERRRRRLGRSVGHLSQVGRSKGWIIGLNKLTFLGF